MSGLAPENEEGRPAGEPDGTNLQVDDLMKSLRREALERLVSGVDGALAVCVVTPTASTRRRVFLTLSAAEKYATRAAELGHLVRVYVVRLDPVTEVKP